MVFLGAVKFGGGRNLRDDRPAELPGSCEPPFRFLGRLPFMLIGIKNDRSVLSADIGTLPVQRGWIVNLPENFQQLLERYARRIILDLHDFGVSRLAAADRPVVGFRNSAARISDRRVGDAFDRAKSRLDTPKASRAEYRKFVCAAHLPT